MERNPVVRKVVGLTAFILLLPVHAVAQELSLAQCQNLKSQIEKYTKLRKGGGPVSQMESWKKSRRLYEDKYRKGDCYKYGSALR